MPTIEWNFQGRTVEVSYTLHKAVPDTHDTPGVAAHVVIEGVKENGEPLNIGDWTIFVKSEYEPFQAYVLGGRE